MIHTNRICYKINDLDPKLLPVIFESLPLLLFFLTGNPFANFLAGWVPLWRFLSKGLSPCDQTLCVTSATSRPLLLLNTPQGPHLASWPMPSWEEMISVSLWTHEWSNCIHFAAVTFPTPPCIGVVSLFACWRREEETWVNREEKPL